MRKINFYTRSLTSYVDASAIKYGRIVILFAVMIVFPAMLYAQGFDDDVNDVPLDGGVSVMIAAGVAYGIKKARRKKTAGKVEPEVKE